MLGKKNGDGDKGGLIILNRGCPVALLYKPLNNAYIFHSQASYPLIFLQHLALRPCDPSCP